VIRLQWSTLPLIPPGLLRRPQGHAGQDQGWGYWSNTFAGLKIVDDMQGLTNVRALVQLPVDWGMLGLSLIPVTAPGWTSLWAEAMDMWPKRQCSSMEGRSLMARAYSDKWMTL
jgi:hypothetical protein